MHKVAPAIALATNILLIHIADATAAEIKRQGVSRVGLLGTRFTMEEAFYKDRLIHQPGLAVLVPNGEERNLVHDVIYDELCLGQIRPESRDRFRQVIHNLVVSGAEAVILSCTELCLLVKPEDSAVPLFDTTVIHARSAVQWAILPQEALGGVHDPAQEAFHERAAGIKPNSISALTFFSHFFLAVQIYPHKYGSAVLSIQQSSTFHRTNRGAL